MIEPVKMLGPDKDVLKFFSDYMLRGVKNLDKDERKLYKNFMTMITMERYIVDESRVNLDDLTKANRPGAIVRTRPDYR